jgi:hypothetical protein
MKNQIKPAVTTVAGKKSPVKVTAYACSVAMITAFYQQCTTKREAAPQRKNWQKLRAGVSGVRQPLDLDRAIFAPATLVIRGLG